MDLGLGDIRAAAGRIAGAVVATPFLRSVTLSKITGAEVWVKFENLQFTASFKERGALNKLLCLTAEEKARGVVAMSAGNHAQGVAYHAQRLGIPATIVMPEGTPFNKVAQTEAFGAEVVLRGAALSDAQAAARAIEAEKGLAFVHPYDDPLIVAGQGTVGLEIAQSGIGLDMAVVPVGGGGLIAGVATALKALMPEVEVVGVEAELFAAMKAMREHREVTVGGATIAEGIAVRNIGTLPFSICERLVGDILTVSEAQLERAVYLLLTIEKTVAEGAGAAGLAAILAQPARFKGKRVAVVLSGGNIDARLLASVIMRELMRDGRICQIEVDVEDLPGQLSRVTSVVGAMGGSILEVLHSRLSLELSAKHTRLEMLFEARDRAHADAITGAIAALGMKVRRVS